MKYSRTDILKQIHTTVSALRADPASPIPEEELTRWEASLKSEAALDLLLFIFCVLVEDTPKEHELLMQKAAHYPLEYLGLSRRTYNGLTAGPHPIKTVAELLALPLAELRKLRNIGDKSIAEITAAKAQFIEEMKRRP